MDFALVLPAGELLRAYALFASPLTLLVGSICGPPAAISCSYRDTGVPCSVVLFCGWPGGLNYQTTGYQTTARSITFL